MKTKTTIAVLGSHSALEVCRGASLQNIPNLVIAQRGREKTYTDYFYKKNGHGCVDSVIVLEKFEQILEAGVQKQLQDHASIFIPNRSFEVYVHNDYDAIEKRFTVPMFGNKFLLRMENRAGSLNQYEVLKKAGIRTPKQCTPEEINRLCIVKAQQKEKKFERAFFFASNFKEYQEKLTKRVSLGVVDENETLRIEEYIIGVPVNLNFFYSPLENRLELLGTDARRQTNVAGLASLPARYQEQLPESIQPTFEEAGHMAVTILESMLEPAFELGERFVTAVKTFHPKGIIGPFSLQTMIVPSQKGKEFVTFDVSPRMPGSPGIEATPYASYYYGKPVSMGERVAMEIKNAIENNALAAVST